MYKNHKKNLNTYQIWHELNSIKKSQKYYKRLCFGPINLEISHHLLDETILNKMALLAEHQGLMEAKEKWLRGEHTPDMPSYIHLRSYNITNRGDFQNQMKVIVNKVREKKWLGCTNKPITDIVNIGIGGSNLGPKFYFDALKSIQIPPFLNCHFISDADYYALNGVLKNLNPETTLFIVSSKSFTTEETMMNAHLAKVWLDHPLSLERHFIAVTANPDIAKQLGYQHIVRFGKWVIGRYSITSPINLINAIMFGFEHYLEFLKGAQEMDQHFLSADCHENLPMLLALIGIWNINFLNIPTQLMMIYHSKLLYFCDYIQQLDMESNGKSHNCEGEKIEYPTAPIIWGGLGNQAQHSYYQLLAQGGHQIAVDFLSVQDSRNEYLNQLCLQRKKSLFDGIETKEPYFSIRHQNSINHIELNEVSPKSIGALIALYEHKIFTQAWLWNINPFDQPGVELAKNKVTEKNNTIGMLEK